ncbi:MAG: prepilin-type N-terminal cleavage/methylation domain-containing protein [bacterium]
MFFINKSKKYSNTLAISKAKGFSFIELLVVMLVISIVTIVVLAILEKTRVKSRDSQRFTELRQLQTAMELYRTDNSSYPTTSTLNTYSIDGCRGFDSTSGTGSDWGNMDSLGRLVSGGYIKSLPVDPVNLAAKGLCYTYTYLRTGENIPWTCTKDGSMFDPDGIDDSGWTGAQKYEYIITFSTEANDLQLPLLNNTPKTYCLMGPAV